MDRYRIESGSGNAVIDQDGDWVKYREANADAWELLRRSNLQAETINMLYKFIDGDRVELTRLRAELEEAQRHLKVLDDVYRHHTDCGGRRRHWKEVADATLYVKGLP